MKNVLTFLGFLSFFFGHIFVFFCVFLCFRFFVHMVSVIFAFFCVSVFLGLRLSCKILARKSLSCKILQNFGRNSCKTMNRPARFCQNLARSCKINFFATGDVSHSLFVLNFLCTLLHTLTNLLSHCFTIGFCLVCIMQIAIRTYFFWSLVKEALRVENDSFPESQMFGVSRSVIRIDASGKRIGSLLQFPIEEIHNWRANWRDPLAMY